MGMWLCTEYDARDAAPRIYSAGPRKTGSLDLGRDNAVSSYTARVGDLCFVAIGQIVNRNLRAIRYQPSACLVINSPVERPVLAELVRKDWGGLTMEQHKKSLVRDACRPGYDADPYALLRLWYYYPDDGEKLALKLLERPLYNDSIVWTFICERLVKEMGPSRWRPLIDECGRKHGSCYAESLPFLLRWIYWRTDLSESQSFREERAVAAKILASLYPPEDINNPTFVNAADPGTQAKLIAAISSFSSHRVDAAIHRVYVAMNRKEFADEQGSVDFDELAEACVRRLIGKRYPDVILPYCMLRAQEIRYAVEDFVDDFVSRMINLIPAWLLGGDPEELDPEKRFDGLPKL